MSKKGLIKTRDGKVLGEHEGLPFYTIGQREGLGISTGRRAYVLEKENESNTLVVWGAEENLSSSCGVSSVSWCSGIVPKEIHASVKIRYRHPGAASKVTALTPDQAAIRFGVPQASVALGQSAVFYDGETVLGGGIISKVDVMPAKAGIQAMT